jgi:hypothetical protein
VPSTGGAKSLTELKKQLSAALGQLETALDLTFALGSEGEDWKRVAAREWERTAKEFLAYAQVRSREEKQNILTWLSMIRLS